MTLKYSHEQRYRILKSLNKNGDLWTDVFEGNRKFYSAAYFDLLTGIWKAGKATKGEALQFIRAIKSSSSVSKCLSTAIREGCLIESDNPDDARSQFVELSPQMKEKIDRFFDAVASETAKVIEHIEKN